jgi:hypothetical protein
MDKFRYNPFASPSRSESPVCSPAGQASSPSTPVKSLFDAPITPGMYNPFASGMDRSPWGTAPSQTTPESDRIGSPPSGMEWMTLPPESLASWRIGLPGAAPEVREAIHDFAHGPTEARCAGIACFAENLKSDFCRPLSSHQGRPPSALAGAAEPYAGLGLNPSERKACEMAGLSPTQAMEAVKMYRNSNLPLNPKTLPGHYVDANLLGSMTPLGSGTYNTVYRASYRDPSGGPNPVQRAFKAEGGETGLAGEVSGIDESSPRSSCRNVAAYKLNELLKWKVIPDTQFAIHDGKAGIVMKLAKGEEPIQSGNYKEDISNLSVGKRLLANKKFIKGRPGLLENYCKLLGLQNIWFEKGRVFAAQTKLTPQAKDLLEKSSVRRELIKLQFLDALIGQGDRHAGNYFIDPKTGKVKGFDNDQAFGKEILAIDELAQKLGVYGFFSVGLPVMVDTKIRDDLLRLTKRDIVAALDNLLLPEEIDATVSRFLEIKKYLENIDQACIIEPHEWDEFDFSLDRDSYVGREMIEPNPRFFSEENHANANPAGWPHSAPQ